METIYSRLDEVDPGPAAGNLVAYTPTVTEIENLFDRTREVLGAVASLPAIKRIASANPDTLHAFSTAGRHSIDRPEADGFICWLPLTAAGLSALRAMTFDPADPSPDHLAGQHDRPAAIYVWGLYGPGRGMAALAWAFQRWSTPQCQGADIYVRAATAAGLKLYQRTGFEPVFPDSVGPGSDLYVFRRTAIDKRPLYDSYPSRSAQYTVTVVRTHDDLAKVMAIRSAVYMAEQTCPYDEEFDGNDFASTHLLGFVGDEPAASIRIRCFADFAKVERLAVRHEFRQSRLALVMIRAAKELCRAKGYARIYGHAQKRLVNLWSRSGARPIPGAPELTFSDFDYVQMLLETEPHPDAVRLGDDPFRIIRPEGRWHAEGILERSSGRPVTRPSIDRPTVGREPPPREQA